MKDNNINLTCRNTQRRSVLIGHINCICKVHFFTLRGVWWQERECLCLGKNHALKIIASEGKTAVY